MFDAWDEWNPDGNDFNSDNRDSYVFRPKIDKNKILKNLICYDAKYSDSYQVRLFSKDVKKILDHTHSKAAFLNEMMGLLCKGKSKPYEVDCTDQSNYLGFGDSQELVDVVDKNLDSGTPKPTAISYCSNMLYNFMNDAPKSFGVGLIGAGCGPHVSIIIGRRSVGGVCQYLIQNSWGTNCSSAYSGRGECDVEVDSYGYTHRNGGKLWVDAELLKRNLFQVSHL